MRESERQPCQKTLKISLLKTKVGLRSSEKVETKNSFGKKVKTLETCKILKISKDKI